VTTAPAETTTTAAAPTTTAPIPTTTTTAAIRPVTTTTTAAVPRPAPISPAASDVEPPVGDCDPSYPGVCIPPSPPDLDCADIPHRRFTVVGADPHRFDGSDDDGIGCESG
jgi:micrococcal nuclease